MRPTEPFRQEHEQLLFHIEQISQAAREVARKRTRRSARSRYALAPINFGRRGGPRARRDAS